MVHQITQWLRRLIDGLLYSNVWIATAAVALGVQTDWLLFGQLRWRPLWGFFFFGTIFLYSLHRLISLNHIGPHQETGRFELSRRFPRLTGAYILLAAAGALWFFFRLSPAVQWSLLIPCLLSMAYVLPVFKQRRRMRDLPYFKIFLIAIAWSWITGALPAVDRHWFLTAPALLLCLERALFLFAISLPFDIRDLAVDNYAQVKTLPSHLGVGRTRLLAAVALLLMLSCGYLNFRLDVYGAGTLQALLISALSSFLLIFFADRVHHDYYFSGLLDGTLILQFALIWWLH